MTPTEVAVGLGGAHGNICQASACLNHMLTKRVLSRSGLERAARLLKIASEQVQTLISEADAGR